MTIDPTPQPMKIEDTKGGVCSKCGIWKGGAYGVNGNGVQSKHVCAFPQPNEIETLKIEFHYWLAAEWEKNEQQWPKNPQVADWWLSKLTLSLEQQKKGIREQIAEVAACRILSAESNHQGKVLTRGYEKGVKDCLRVPLLSPNPNEGKE